MVLLNLFVSPNTDKPKAMSSLLEEERFDGTFLMIAQQSQGIEPLLDAVFSFLRRKTDFFTGASPEVINETVARVVRKHSDLNERTKAEKRAAQAKDEARTAAARKVFVSPRPPV